jgi:hypothetical protein
MQVLLEPYVTCIICCMFRNSLDSRRPANLLVALVTCLLVPASTQRIIRCIRSRTGRARQERYYRARQDLPGCQGGCIQGIR